MTARATALIPGFHAETALERRLIRDSELSSGLRFGCPRFGHPEGRVGLHVADILGRIGPDEADRARLRLIALVHDSFKYRVPPGVASNFGTTPGTVSGMMDEIRPESPEFLATLRRFVGSSMICRASRPERSRSSSVVCGGRRDGCAGVPATSSRPRCTA